MRLMSRGDVEAWIDSRTEDVPVPEWGEGVGVRIKVLTCAEHRALTAAFKGITDDATISAHLVVACCIDAEGRAMFGLGDLPMLLGKSSTAIKRIGHAAAKLNRMAKDDEEDAKKNSSPTQTSDSGLS